MNNTCMYLYTPPCSWLLTYIPVYFRYSKCNGPRELFLLYKTVLYFTDISSYMYFSSLWGWFTFSIHSNNSYLHCTIINIFNAPEVCLYHGRKLLLRKRLYGRFSAYWLRSKCRMCCQHICLSVPPLSCAGFVYCHCIRRRAVLDNTHGKNSDAFTFCTATTMALTSSKQKVVWSVLDGGGEEWRRVWCFWLDIIVAACDVFS